MRSKFSLTRILFVPVLFCIYSCGNPGHLSPDLSKINDSTYWTVTGRKVSYKNSEVLMENVKQWQEGFARVNNLTFGNGRIELDIKGVDDPGNCFVGVIFHGVNEKTFDMIYFRPFNFRDPVRANHSVQYVAPPSWDWDNLREMHPGVYENTVNPVPGPNDWFHASIIVQYPKVSVFINKSDTASLVVNKLDSVKRGWIGLWANGGADVWFRNLKVIPD